ncbi:hypothetical protein HUG17_1836 [Dermatophagoides farinae]|nr:uncharacterized protein LOC124499460 [Dermatophagoides farinae]KAH7646298.1 hypothetical protein HUG17_1836 [Dermatophagoides farinae]
MPVEEIDKLSKQPAKSIILQNVPKEKRSISLQTGSSTIIMPVDEKSKTTSVSNAPPIRTVSTETDLLPPMTQISDNPKSLPITKTGFSLLPGLQNQPHVNFEEQKIEKNEKFKPSSIAIEVDFNPSPTEDRKTINFEQSLYQVPNSPIKEPTIIPKLVSESKVNPPAESVVEKHELKTKSPPPSSPSSSSELSHRTVSLSDPDLYYLSLPPHVKISHHPHGDDKPFQPSQPKAETSKESTKTNVLPHRISFHKQKSVTSGPSEMKDSPYSTVRSIRFEHHKRVTSKSMRALSHTGSQNQHSIVSPKHYQSALLKFTPETATLVPIGNEKSRHDIRTSMRWKSTNLSHMQVTCHSDTDISDTTPEINNNYLDNNNASDNEAMAILPIEARELLMQEEEDRKSRLAKESTSLLRIPGLGTRRESKFFPGRIRKRVILKNGNINLCPEHVDKRSRRYLQDTFTTMVDIRWRWNLLVFAMGFLGSWFGFSIIWWLIAFSHSDFEHLHDEEWTPCVANLRNFASAILFSIETQHTIGYGSRFTTEECPEAMFLMMLQSITGVMIQCFMVGFIFAKLSRPQKRSQTLMFSRYAIVNTRDGEMCLMFRVGDLRDRSHIIGAKVSAQLIRKKMTSEGEMIPYFHQKLNVKFDEIDDEVFLIWPAIIVHIIDKDSPFYTMNVDDMTREKFEIIAILEGTVESTGQTIQARTSYLPSEILWGHRFEQLIRYRHDTGEYLVDYSKFNNTFDVDSPLCSAKELKEELRQQKVHDDDESDQL